MVSNRPSAGAMLPPDKHLGSTRRASADQRSTRSSEAVVVLAILHEANPQKARSQYLNLFELDDINDQDIHDRLQDHVFHAIMSDEPTVEIERELAECLLLLVKNGMKRPRGGRRKDRWQKMRLATLVRIGRQTKMELAARGLDATQAHLQAAEDAEEEARKHGLHYKAGYLAREMQRAEPRR
jgi:hypothetical protein